MIIDITVNNAMVSTEVVPASPDEPPSLLMRLQSASRAIPMSVPPAFPVTHSLSFREILDTRLLALILTKYESTSIMQWTELWAMGLVPRNYRSSSVADRLGWMVFAIGWRSVSKDYGSNPFYSKAVYPG